MLPGNGSKAGEWAVNYKLAHTFLAAAGVAPRGGHEVYQLPAARAPTPQSWLSRLQLPHCLCLWYHPKLMSAQLGQAAILQIWGVAHSPTRNHAPGPASLSRPSFCCSKLLFKGRQGAGITASVEACSIRDGTGSRQQAAGGGRAARRGCQT